MVADDRIDRCPACGSLGTEFVSETPAEITSRCLNPECTVGTYVETAEGMYMYDRPDVKA